MHILIPLVFPHLSQVVQCDVEILGTLSLSFGQCPSLYQRNVNSEYTK